MPIANCIVLKENLVDSAQSLEQIVEAWAYFADLPEQHMSVNFIANQQQVGCQYVAMAHLLVPTAWSAESLDALQLGLAQALAKLLEVPTEFVQVSVSTIESGRVVENAKKIEW